MRMMRVRLGMRVMKMMGEDAGEKMSRLEGE